MEDSHFEEINRRIDSLQGAHLSDKDELKKSIQDLSDLIKPMVETYVAASKLGQWAVGLVTFISIIFGIWTAIEKLIRHH